MIKHPISANYYDYYIILYYTFHHTAAILMLEKSVFKKQQPFA